MNVPLMISLRSEWLKKKGSLASWIVIIGGIFIPAIIAVARVINHDRLSVAYQADGFWRSLWGTTWQSMAIFLLPIGLILATSLMAQLEYKNNTWKQLHTTPLSLTVIFLSKFLMLMLMMLQFFILFNFAVYLSALIPWLLVKGVSYPQAPIPYGYFLREDCLYFMDCLPIVALQFALSLHFRNFLISLGSGFLLWIGAVGGLQWQYGYTLPYTYPMYNFLKGSANKNTPVPQGDIHAWAIGYFLLFLLAGYLFYIFKREKG